MNDISIIGLGSMGSAIAMKLIESGYCVNVWNRTKSKANLLQSKGAFISLTFTDAILASNCIIICLDSYDSFQILLNDAKFKDELQGKTFIQLSTGTPTEARYFESYLTNCGANYLDGVLFCYPSMIGKTGSELLISGRKEYFENSNQVLSYLVDNMVYLGDNIASAAAIDLGVLSVSVAQYMGVAHGAQICISEGVKVSLLAKALKHGIRCKEMAEIIDANAFELGSLYDGASLKVWNSVVDRMLKHADETNSNDQFPKFLTQIYQKAVDGGYGEEDRAALVKVLL